MQNVYGHSNLIVKHERPRASIADNLPQKQPPILPRPDVNALGVTYRRIPLMSIGRDVYADTRIILSKLEELFPEGKLGATDSDGKALEKLLESWTIDSGIFVRASQLIPPDMPLLMDPKFSKDREDFSGRPWSKEKILENRPEAIAHIRNAFSLLETTLLADDRDWILKTDKPSLADIEGEREKCCIALHMPQAS
jgi:glutathione S-transferase